MTGDIPETVYAAAREAYHSAFGDSDTTTSIAIYEAASRAIMAERERCAEIVKKGLGRTNTAIYGAIVSGDAP